MRLDLPFPHAPQRRRGHAVAGNQHDRTPAGLYRRCQQAGDRNTVKIADGFGGAFPHQGFEQIDLPDAGALCGKRGGQAIGATGLAILIEQPDE